MKELAGVGRGDDDAARALGTSIFEDLVLYKGVAQCYCKADHL